MFLYFMRLHRIKRKLSVDPENPKSIAEKKVLEDMLNRRKNNFARERLNLPLEEP